LAKNIKRCYVVQSYTAVVRIIAGEFRSRVLKTLPGMDLRPTSDRLRETLFNILGDVVHGAVFVDAYAGSGAVGLEALSRGASQAIFMEQSKGSLRVLRQNIDSLGLTSKSLIFEGPAARNLRKVSAAANIIFLDPPYADDEEYERALEVLAGSDTEALIVVEHAYRVVLPVLLGLTCTRLKRQGDSALSFFLAKKILTG
jgi:16S rRNA (guanine966-N2)-methyltransferase